jgi:hypothetical protein
LRDFFFRLGDGRRFARIPREYWFASNRQPHCAAPHIAA